MALPLLWSMLPSIISAGTKLATRPKKRDYLPDTSYIDKYIASLQGRRSGREVARMAMYPALRAIGTQAATQRREIEYESAKYGVRGSGIEAQQKLSAGQQAITAAQEVGERAGAMQIQEGRRIEDYIQRLTMQKGQMEDIGRREFRQARRQSRAEIIGGVAQIGVAAGAGIAQGVAAKKAAGLDTAQFEKYQNVLDKVSGGEDVTREELTGLSQEQQGKVRNILRTTTSAERKGLSEQYKGLQETYGSEVMRGAAERFGYESPAEFLSEAQTGNINLDYLENYLKEEGEKATPFETTIGQMEIENVPAGKVKELMPLAETPEQIRAVISLFDKLEKKQAPKEISTTEQKAVANRSAADREILTVQGHSNYLRPDPQDVEGTSSLNRMNEILSSPLEDIDANLPELHNSIRKYSETAKIPITTETMSLLAEFLVGENEINKDDPVEEQERKIRIAWSEKQINDINNALKLAGIVTQQRKEFPDIGQLLNDTGLF